jgi:ubiquitin carboxyl-terminal hydrolase L3
MTKSWLPLEANPDILLTYSLKLGLPGNFLFHDVLSTEDWALDMIPGEIEALLLLFPISEASEKERRSADTADDEHVYFMKQTVGNACGTIAVLHTMLNICQSDKSAFTPDSFISRMLEKTLTMNPLERGSWLESNEEIENAHRIAEIQGQSDTPSHAEQEVDTHFTVFLPNKQSKEVLELDGRRAGPIRRGAYDSDVSFPQKALQVIQKEFMDRNPSDIRFSIVALCRSE